MQIKERKRSTTFNQKDSQKFKIKLKTLKCCCNCEKPSDIKEPNDPNLSSNKVLPISDSLIEECPRGNGFHQMGTIKTVRDEPSSSRESIEFKIETPTRRYSTHKRKKSKMMERNFHLPSEVIEECSPSSSPSPKKKKKQRSEFFPF